MLGARAYNWPPDVTRRQRLGDLRELIAPPPPETEDLLADGTT